MKKYYALYALIVLVAFGCSNTKSEPIPFSEFTHAIPCEGNTWVINNKASNKELIGKEGIRNWTSTNDTIRTYFKTEKTGTIAIGLLAKSQLPSTVEVSVGALANKIRVESTALDTLAVGRFTISEPGYHYVELTGLKKEGASFPEIKKILLGGEATSGKVWFVKEDFYWGRRGPSVHLGFQVPEKAGDVEYFYNEITVPKGNDVLGSYFMANGFGQGYFGIQVNSPTERRVLFSVWSPFHTDNPEEIPEEQRIQLLKKGEDVYTGKFGNEGSGGQSYYKYMWKAGTSYKFLLKGTPAKNKTTDFTAWFFAPEVNEWRLIASFRRPQTNTYLTQLYSFLENFYTEQGNVERRVNFSNQWVYTTQQEWIELTKIKFTADATARKESRMDYAGGVEGSSFFLKNCGFFDQTTLVDSYFERTARGKHPVIDFDSLP